MAAKKRKKREPSHPDERWLLSYADMVTLLMCLFMVLFSISSVNKSKFEGLQRSLKDAFSGKVLPGGKALQENGGASTDVRVVAPPLTADVRPKIGGNSDAPGKMTEEGGAKDKEGEAFKKLKRRIDAFTRAKGISGQVQTRITRDGLAIRLLTDKLLFDSGSAFPKPQSAPLLDKVSQVLGAERDHQITVMGYTDDVPIRSSQYPTNWELSGARAAAVVRSMSRRVALERMTAAGRADLDPVTDNDSIWGRSINRRVEILLPRNTEAPS